MEDCISILPSESKFTHPSKADVAKFTLISASILMLTVLLGLFAHSDWIIIGI